MSSTDFWAEPQDLVSIATETPQAKTLEFDDGFEACEKVTVTTKHGNMDVFIQGNRALKPIVTVHEIGLNYKSCFKGMLSHSKAEPFKKKFCFYHINLPGQGANDATLSSFPSMDGLAEMVDEVAIHFKMPGFVGIGAGAGANVLLRVALNQPTIKINGLLLISPILQSQWWGEWVFDKIARMQTNNAAKMPSFVVEQYLKTYFGVKTMENNLDLVQMFRRHLAEELNPQNFRQFQAAYAARTDLMSTISPDTFDVPVLMMYGGQSTNMQWCQDSIEKFPKDRFSNIKIWECGDMLHEEEPDEVLVAFRLFLQGLGLIF